MDSPRAPRFLAFIAFAAQDELDATWIKDAVDAASRRLSLPQVVGLDAEAPLVRVDEQGSVNGVDSAIFLIVLWSRNASDCPRLAALIERFVARPTQTTAGEYLIPIIVPSEAGEGLTGCPAPLQERLQTLTRQWVPTLTRRPDDGTWSAWTRVTEQTVALMARVLLSVAEPPHGDNRQLVVPQRARDRARALESALAVVSDIERQQAGLQTTRRRVAEASRQLVRRGIELTGPTLDRPRFDPDALQSEINAASEAYLDEMESTVETAALRLYEAERRAHTITRGAEGAHAVSALEPILCDLHDQIVPEQPLSNRLREVLNAPTPDPQPSTPASSTVGAALGFLLGPVGALVGGAMGTAVGAARGHRQKKESLTQAVRQSLDSVVDQAQRSVEQVLHSIDDELLGLYLEWQARVALLQSKPTTSDTERDLVECDVFAPASVARGKSLFVQIVFHGKEEPHDVGETVPPGADDLPPRFTLALSVQPQQRVGAHLHIPGCVVAHPIQETTWRGEVEDMGFTVPGSG